MHVAGSKNISELNFGIGFLGFCWFFGVGTPLEGWENCMEQYKEEGSWWDGSKGGVGWKK